jgi:hypothetical protein
MAAVLALLPGWALSDQSCPPTVLLPGSVFSVPPDLSSGKGFGLAVAGLGVHSLGDGGTLIVGAPLVDLPGASEAGRAYLFSTNPSVVGLDSPAPVEQGHFGTAVAGAGGDVLVGAPGERAGGVDGAGVVYRFGPDGTPLGTIVGPGPISYDGFGAAVSAGSTLVLVGAPARERPDSGGTAYLFDAAGVPHALDRPSPSPGALFGAAVALSGSDAYVGAPFEGGAGQERGLVYLFEADSSNAAFGQLVHTFANPDSAALGGGIGEGFGTAVAATDELLVVGAPFAAAGAEGAGVVQVFDARRSSPTFGRSLKTISNPTPTAGAAFGAAVAIVDGHILVGAPFDDSDGSDAGTVYQFEASSPFGAVVDSPRLIPATPTNLAKLGSSIAPLGADGDIVVGAPGAEQGLAPPGAALVFASCGNGITSGGEACDPDKDRCNRFAECTSVCTFRGGCGFSSLQADAAQQRSAGPIFCGCSFPPCGPGDPDYCCVDGQNLCQCSSDGIACTVNDRCEGPGGQCRGVPKDTLCDDGNPCTVDTCDATVGCVHQPVVCADDDPCTVDSCDPASGQCIHDSTGCDCHKDSDCDDDNVCNGVYRCVRPCEGCSLYVTDRPCCTKKLRCELKFDLLKCDDHNPCTDDACDPVGGCTTTPKSCDDGISCTIDSCDPTRGCVHDATFCPKVGSPCPEGGCDDHNPCTNDVCDPAVGCTTTPRSCDGGSRCTTSSCDPLHGCRYTAIPGCCTSDADCAGTSACTINERCVGGTCVSDDGCDDANPCTRDTCSPDGGCGHEQVVGCEAVTCGFSRQLAISACTGQPIDGIAGWIKRVAGPFQQACDASSAVGRRKLVRKGLKQLHKATMMAQRKATAGRITRACRDALRGTINELAQPARNWLRGS